MQTTEQETQEPTKDSFKDFIASLGGSVWACVLGLSALVTILLGFGIPSFIDTYNPWVVLFACTSVFILGFFNGWKQRGFKNTRDIEYADFLERGRIELSKMHDVEIARINAEKDLELDRRNREDFEHSRVEAEKREAERQRARHERIRSAISSLTLCQKSIIGRIINSGNACKLPKRNTEAAFLEDIGIIEKLDVVDASNNHWKLSEIAASVLENDRILYEEMIGGEAQEREAKLLHDFLHADYRQKLLAALLYKTGKSPIPSLVFSKSFNSLFMDYSVLEKDMRSVWLTEDMMEMLNNNQHALDFYDSERDDEIQWLAKTLVSACIHE